MKKNTGAHVQYVYIAGTDDKPIQIYETGDEDYKIIAIYDKYLKNRYQLVFSNGKLTFRSYTANGETITDKVLA